MKTKLSVGYAFGFMIEKSVINVIPLVAALVLYILTIWIPYINVGTTIALSTIPIKISRSHVINPFFIFDKVYREKMGEYFLLVSLTVIPVMISFFFMIVPAIVLSLTWSLAIYLLLDKKIDNPVECLVESNRRTKGYKWSMFLIVLAFVLGIFIINYIFTLIFGFLFGESSFLFSFFYIILLLVEAPMNISLSAYFYKVLVLDVDDEEAKVESVVENVETQENPVV
ncbi:MAG: hypothetical protein WCQ82_08735 [Bacteroidaceae bacterium]